jgi:Ca-activated chloride channel family protein
VLDASGRPVLDLSLADFRLEKDGQTQKIVRLSEPGATPIEMALLVDVSGSVRERLLFEQQAAAAFLREVLRPVDSVTVFSIGIQPKLVQVRTSNVEAAVAAIMKLEPTKEATSFYQSLVEATSYMARAGNPGSRRVLVVISDGEDNHSENIRFADAQHALLRDDCMFYSINPGGTSIELNLIAKRAQDQMAALASEIGGAFVVGSHDQLPAVFRRIAAELRAQYMLGFYFTEERTDGGYRQIAVQVPGRPELRVRARQGYYAPQGSW